MAHVAVNCQDCFVWAVTQTQAPVFVHSEFSPKLGLASRQSSHYALPLLKMSVVSIFFGQIAHSGEYNCGKNFVSRIVKNSQKCLYLEFNILVP